MQKKMLFALFALLFPVVAPAQTFVDIATDATDPNNLADSEPSIAINPLDPNQIAVVAFSGGWSSVAGTKAPIWFSNDGGTTWTKQFVLAPPQASSPAPGDQNLVYSADGTLYVVELPIGVDVPNIFIYRPSGGVWSAGTAFGGDQPMIRSSGTTLLSVWLNITGSVWQSMSERTTDSGVTVTQAAIGSTAFGNRTTRIAVGPTAGTTYAIYKTREGQLPGGNFETATFRVVRSTDAGVTWNSPGVPVHPGTVRTWYTAAWGNPQNGGKVGRARSSDAWIAVNPTTGAIWVVYCNRDGSTFGQIYAAMSSDGGTTWSSPVRVTDGTANSAYPEVAVAANGTVAVMYVDYDDRGTLTVYTHKMARSYDNGSTWRNIELQSFTTQSLSNPSNAVDGFLWGDYEGLTAAGNMFYGVFTGRSLGRRVIQLDPIFVKITAVPVSIVEAIDVVPAIRGNFIEDIYAFVKGSDGNLWVRGMNGDYLAWANQGKPSGVSIDSGVGAVSPSVTTPPGWSTGRGQPYVFIKGSDGNLWMSSWSGSGSALIWTNQRTPGGSPSGIATPVGVIMVGGQPTVFVKGLDGNLWLHSSDASTSAWNNQGRPSGVSISTPVGATTVGGRPYAFILGGDGNLWANWWSGTGWRWSNQGTPPGVNITGAIGATTGKDVQPYVFVLGSDGNVWMSSLSGSNGTGNWGWTNLVHPAGVSIASAVGAVAGEIGVQPHIFVLGSDGNLWLNWSGQWSTLGRPPTGQSIVSAIGVSSRIEGKYPQVCFLGSDGNLWLASAGASDFIGVVEWEWLNQGLP